MSFHNRLLLNRAAVSGLRVLEVMVLVAPGRSAEISSRIERLGGRVRREDASVGYLRATVAIDKVVELVADNDIEAYQVASSSRASWYRDGPPQANADMYRELERVMPSRGNTLTETGLQLLPVELSRLPGYTGDEDVGVGAWLQEHPTFDGRGVTIAILEPAEIEFSHPVLAPAKTVDGRDVPKLAGILNTLDDDASDGTRVRLEAEIHASTAWNRIGDRTYALPRPGTFRFGVYVLPVAINLLHTFGLLMDATTQEIWVDTDGDADFRDETPTPDVNDRFEPRSLKLTYPSSVDVSFVVAHGRTRNTVHLYLATGSHHTMTTSVAAGGHSADGLAHGVAPGARVLLVRNATPDHRLSDIVEGLLEAARRVDVDILSDSQGVLVVPDTAADFVGRLMRRVVMVHRKPIFIPAGNTQLFLNNISALGEVFSVGGLIGPKTQAALFGGVPIDGPMVHPIGAAGPAIDGALKPDFLAPMQRLAADIYRGRAPILVPRSSPQFELPPGYRISCCTSASAPYAAGVGALLLSGAKQLGVTFSLNQLQRAFRVSARFLDGWPAHQQGHGALDIAAAWRELGRDVDIPAIRVSSSIVHPLARYAARGNEGEGLYERDGWTVGMTGHRVMRLRRESGTIRTIRYRLSWTGNDGTFATQPAIVLPMGSDVELRVGITVRSNGAHSAILNLHDPVTDAVVLRTLATIVAAERLDTDTVIRATGSVPVLRRTSHLFVVPEDSGVVQITLQVLKGTAQASVIPSHSLYPNYYGHVHALGGRDFTPGTYHLALPNPAAGTWTVDVGNLGGQPTSDPTSRSGETMEYVISLRLLSAAVRPRLLRSGQLAIDVENRGATPKEPVMETSLGTLRSHAGEASITGLPNQFEIIVPEESSTLALKLRNADASENEFELHLYDCTSGECFSYDFTLPAARQQKMVVRRPKAGRWVAAVNAAPFPAGPGRFVLDEIIAGFPRSLPPRGLTDGRSRKAWTETIDLPAASDPPPGATPIVLCELVDAEMNREEEAHPWETRVNELLSNLAGRRPTIGSAIHPLRTEPPRE